MTQVAFVQTDHKWHVCEVSQIQPDDVFYIITDGQRGDVRRATGTPSAMNINNEQVWTVESVPHE